MGEGPAKKKRKTKADAGSGDAEASAKASKKSADAGGAASSVAEVLAKALPKPAEPVAAQDEDGGALTTRFSRLFSGGGGGLFAAGAQASQSARTPSASSAAAPRGTGKPTVADVIASRKRPRSSEPPATSSAAGAAAEAKAEAKAEGEAAAAGREQPAKDAKDRPEGNDANRRPRKPSGPLTPEEKKQREARLLFVGNVPLQWDEKRLRRALREAVGDLYTGGMKPIWFRCEPLKVKWSSKKWKDGHKLKDYAEGVADAKHGYAELDSPEAVRIVSKAIHGFKADENHILRGDGVGESSTLQNFDRKRSVFVGNLPAATTEDDLRKALAPVGSIDAVRVVRDKEAKACKGFAFVRFEHRAGVKLAMELKNPEVKGRPLRIMKVTDQSEESKVKAHQEWELTPAARRILMREQKKQRSKINKAVAKRKEIAAVSGKRKGTRTKTSKRSKDTKGKSGRKKKAKK